MIYLGIDIGGTSLKGGLVNPHGEILKQKTLRTPTNFVDFSDSLKTLTSSLIEGSEVLAGVGIGCKGIVNPMTSEVEICPGTFSFLETHRLDRLLADILPSGVPVVADNDARAALVGEVLWGAAKGLRNALMLTLGTGLGGAILAEGQIVRGANGVAGHLGHLTVVPHGKPCVCGNRGCLETVFSASAIEAVAIDSVHRGCESALTEKFRDNYRDLTCLDVFQIAEAGDRVAQSLVRDAIELLGGGIAGLLHAFDPEVLIIGGNIAQAGPSLFDPLRAEIYGRTNRWIRAKPPIISPKAADTTGIAGAAGLCFPTTCQE